MTAKKKKQTNNLVVITGIICLTGLEVCALLKGINGTLFTIVAAIIAGAIGVVIPTPDILKK